MADGLEIQEKLVTYTSYPASSLLSSSDSVHYQLIRLFVRSYHATTIARHTLLLRLVLIVVH